MRYFDTQIDIEISIIQNKNLSPLKTQNICGPRPAGYNHRVSYCEKSCEKNEDCKNTCACGAVNKSEVCETGTMVFDCVNSKAYCENNVCVLEN